MTRTQLHLSLLLGTALTLTAVACGESSASLSPTGPSRSSNATTGAVITGRVRGIGLSPTITNSFSAETAGTSVQAAATSVRVTIRGTSISTMVDGTGQFTLTGVPPGTVTLTFTGSGISASITLNNVGADDEISIDVRLNGTDARLESEHHRHRDDGDDDDDRDEANEIKGAVSALSGTCPALTFTIGTRTVKTSAATVFEDPCTLIRNAVRLEVKGLTAADDTFTATRVELDD